MYDAGMGTRPRTFSLRSLLEAVLYLCIGLTAVGKSFSTNMLSVESPMVLFAEWLIAATLFGAALGAILGRRLLFAGIGFLSGIAFCFLADEVLKGAAGG